LNTPAVELSVVVLLCYLLWYSPGVWSCYELAEEGRCRPDSCSGRYIEMCPTSIACPTVSYW